MVELSYAHLHLDRAGYGGRVTAGPKNQASAASSTTESSPWQHNFANPNACWSFMAGRQHVLPPAPIHSAIPSDGPALMPISTAQDMCLRSIAGVALHSGRSAHAMRSAFLSLLLFFATILTTAVDGALIHKDVPEVIFSAPSFSSTVQGNGIQPSPDGSLIYVTSADGALTALDAENGQVRFTIQPRPRDECSKLPWTWYRVEVGRPAPLLTLRVIFGAILGLRRLDLYGGPSRTTLGLYQSLPALEY